MHLIVRTDTPLDDVGELVLAGDLDAGARAELEAAAGALPCDLTLLVLDMTGVQFIDGTGLHSLEALCERYRKAGAEISIVGAGRVVRKVFEICRSPLAEFADIT